MPVPRWPVGFGDKKQAEAMLRKALTINPDGIDPNSSFTGSIWSTRIGSPKRVTTSKRALKASPRPGRELADQGRRQEVQALLNKIGR